MSDQWETFCDECYYHMWRLRRENERGWNDGFHINTRDEAQALCKLLNKLEGELAAVTEERDELKSKYRTHHDEAERITNEIRRVSSVCRELKQKIAAVTKERDELKMRLVWIDFSDQLPPPKKLVMAISQSSALHFGYQDGDRFYDMDYGWVAPTHWMEIYKPDGSPIWNIDDEVIEMNQYHD